MLASKEVENWSVSDLKKIINWKEVKDDGATPARKKYLLVSWDLVWGRPEPTLPKQSEEDTDMYLAVDSDTDDDLCKFDDQHQLSSILI